MARKIVCIVPLLIFFFVGCKSERENDIVSKVTFKCTPCNLDCDTIYFDKTGFCPQRNHNQYR